MKALPVLVLSILALVPPGCSTDGNVRARLYATGPDDPVQQALATPARLTVVYWPALGKCMPTEMALLDAFDEIQQEYPDIRFVTVMPAVENPEAVLRYGRPLPGELLRLEPEHFQDQDRLSPRPRIEVWSAQGQLLLLHSIPPFVPRARAVAEEIVWARSFTAPLAAVEGR